MREDFVFLRTGELRVSLRRQKADMGLMGESTISDLDVCISKLDLGLNYLLII